MSYGRGPPDLSGMTSLKVDNLTYRTTTDDLKRIFQKYGEIGDVYIPRDRFNRESRGFAFVRYYDRRDAEDAMDSLDGTIVDGRELRVQLAKYGRPSDSRRGPSRRYGRYRYIGPTLCLLIWLVCFSIQKCICPTMFQITFKVPIQIQVQIPLPGKEEEVVHPITQQERQQKSQQKSTQKPQQEQKPERKQQQKSQSIAALNCDCPDCNLDS